MHEPKNSICFNMFGVCSFLLGHYFDGAGVVDGGVGGGEEGRGDGGGGECGLAEEVAGDLGNGEV